MGLKEEKWDGETREVETGERIIRGGEGIISDENYGSREPCEKELWEKGIVGKGNFGKRELWGKV